MTGTAGMTGAAGATGGTGPGGSAGGQAGTGPTCTPPLMPGSGISLVTGPQVGIGTIANSALRKTITARDTSSNPAFMVTGAWLVDPTMRPGQTYTPSAFVFFAVTNRGSVPVCDIQLSKLVYRDAAGANINAMFALSETSNSAYVVGATGMECAGLRDTWVGCLAPGESSFAWNLIGFPGASVATTPIVGADFTILAATGLADAQPDFTLVVESYTVETPDPTMPQRMNITVRNDGPQPAAVGYLPWFLLDEQGAPLDWSAVNTFRMILEPGQTGVLTDPNVVFDGAGTRVLFSTWGSPP